MVVAQKQRGKEEVVEYALLEVRTMHFDQAGKIGHQILGTEPRTFLQTIGKELITEYVLLLGALLVAIDHRRITQHLQIQRIAQKPGQFARQTACAAHAPPVDRPAPGCTRSPDP